jgi:ABC-type nitrate/sulfonate/bicarbonate transport system substrate-binding protein
VKRVLRALLKANRFILEDKKGAVDILQRWGRTSLAVAEQGYLSSSANFSRSLLAPRDALEKVIHSTKLNIDLKREVSLDEVFDLSIVREILREMGETPKD